MPVLDHDHKHGHIRGVLCRGCNALLGHIENNRYRNNLSLLADLCAFLRGSADYLEHYRVPRTEYTHHTWRDEDQKRELRNSRARKKRAASKKEPT